MTGSDSRVGLGGIVAGITVAVATSALFVVLGGALAATLWNAEIEHIVGEAQIVGGWLLAALTVGAFIGGRSAAVSSRVLVRRDGAFAGLVTWAGLTIVFLAAILAWMGLSPEMAWSFRPYLATALWALFTSQLVTLIAALAGGVAGARAEARSIGLRSVHFAKRGFATSADDYERDFFGSSALSATSSSDAVMASLDRR